MNKIAKYIIAGIMVGSAFGLWWSVNDLIKSTVENSWWSSISFFGLFFIVWSMFVLVEKNKWLILTVSSLSLASGLFLMISVSYLIILILAGILLFFGAQIIRQEINSRIKISIWNSLRLGRRLFVLAISLVIVIGFLLPELSTGGGKYLPKINIGSGQIKLMSKMMSVFDSSLATIDLEKTTVDEYILNQQTNDIIGIERKMILSAGQESISKLVKRPVNGQEKMLNIFTEIINDKLGDYFNVNIGYADQTIFLMPWLLTILALLTVFSVGMFFSPLLILLVKIIFSFLVAVGLLNIKKEEVLREVI